MWSLMIDQYQSSAITTETHDKNIINTQEYLLTTSQLKISQTGDVNYFISV